jgi:hypothetical protein
MNDSGYDFTTEEDDARRDYWERKHPTEAAENSREERMSLRGVRRAGMDQSDGEGGEAVRQAL